MPGEIKPLIICTTARSGSNLLSDYLNQTGRLGEIAEYFNPEIVRKGHALRRFRLDGALSLTDYIRFLSVEQAAPDGRWGAKVLYEDVEYLLRFPAMQEFLKGGRLVFLRRRAKLSQAISYVLATATGKWMAIDIGRQAAEDVAFDYLQIENVMTLLAIQEARWSTIFTRFGLETLEIIYEDLIADPAATIRQIAAWAGLQDQNLPIRTDMAEQKSPVNATFAARYLAQMWRQKSESEVVEYGGVTFAD